MATVRIPTVLRTHTAGHAHVEADGTTVAETLEELARRHPTLREQILHEGKIRRHINVYVDDEDVRYLQGEATPVTPHTTITIMPAVAGGNR